MPTLSNSAGVVLWSTNQRVDSALLQAIGGIAERSLWDGFVNNLFGDRRGFIGDSFQPSKGVGDLDYVLEEGWGIGVRQTASAPFEADRIPFFKFGLTSGSLAAHDPTDPRIDIITITPATTDDESQSLKILSGGSLVSQNLNTRRTRVATVNVIQGTPDPSPVAPATPPGDELVATISVPATSGPIVVLDSRARTGVASGAAGWRPWRFVPTSISPKSSNRKTVAGVIQDLEGNTLDANILGLGERFVEAIVTDRNGDPDNTRAFIQNVPVGGNESLIGEPRVIAKVSNTGAISFTVEDATASYVDDMFLQVTPHSYYDSTTEESLRGTGYGFPTVVKIDFSS